MTGTEVTAWITAALLATAATTACKGWLLDTPDGARRYKSRLVTFLALLVIASLWLGRDINEHRWWKVALDVVSCWFAYDYAGKNWRLLEASRKLERLQPWRKDFPA